MSEFRDPYEDMSDDEFDQYVSSVIPKRKTRSISSKVPETLLERTKVVAEELGLPYQTLVKLLWEAGLQRFEESPSGDPEAGEGKPRVDVVTRGMRGPRKARPGARARR